MRCNCHDDAYLATILNILLPGTTSYQSGALTTRPHGLLDVYPNTTPLNESPLLAFSRVNLLN